MADLVTGHQVFSGWRYTTHGVGCYSETVSEPGYARIGVVALQDVGSWETVREDMRARDCRVMYALLDARWMVVHKNQE